MICADFCGFFADESAKICLIRVICVLKSAKIRLIRIISVLQNGKIIKDQLNI